MGSSREILPEVDPRAPATSVPYWEAHDNEHLGIPSFTREAHIDLNSFLEITPYSEHGGDDHYDEMKKTHTLTRASDGSILIQVSAAISTNGFHAAMTEANNFEDQTKEHETIRRCLPKPRRGLKLTFTMQHARSGIKPKELNG